MVRWLDVNSFSVPQLVPYCGDFEQYFHCFFSVVWGGMGFASFWFDTFIPPVTHLTYPISRSGVENDDRQTSVAFLEDGNGVEAVIAKRRNGLIAFPLEVRFSRNCCVLILRLLGN